LRADRLLSLLMLLQNRGRMSARELAVELEVSERTIYRDIDALGTTGVPIYGEPGREGGYALLDSYRTTLTGLSESEVRALFMLSIPAPLADLGVSREFKAALLKLTAALPAAHRQGEEKVRQRFYLDSTWWDRDEGPVPHLQVLHQAVWNDRRVILKHQPMPEALAMERKVDPYGLVAKSGAWYLVFGLSDNPPELRSPRVHRVGDLLDVRSTGEAFARPDDFELESFWKEWCAVRTEERRFYRVLVRVAPTMVNRLPWYFGDGIRRRMGEVGPPDADGWVRLELFFDYFEVARARLMAFGQALEVLEPEPLRLSILDHAQQLIKLYDR